MAETTMKQGLGTSPGTPVAGGGGVRECHGLDTPARVCFYEQDFYVLSNFSALTAKLAEIDASLKHDESDWNNDTDSCGHTYANVNVTALRVLVAEAKGIWLAKREIAGREVTILATKMFAASALRDPGNLAAAHHFLGLANTGWKRAFGALHDVLERIAGPRNADLSYAELHHESQRWAADALHVREPVDPPVLAVSVDPLGDGPNLPKQEA